MIGTMESSGIQLLDDALFQELIERARKSPRLRTNHNFHSSLDENANRFLNVMLRGTYITPHRHMNPPKPEGFIVLEGEVAAFTFTADGQVDQAFRLGRDKRGIDLPAGVWHTFAVMSDHAVCYEAKPGPYSAANDKEFASWAPREGDPGATQYLANLISKIRA
jgi:cupin fold WbuC family metalloprotein